LTRELCLAAHNAHAAYIKRVEEDERKKAENKKKTLTYKAEEERLQIAAEKASRDKSDIFQQDKKLLAQETELRADIKVAEGLLQEGNDKLVLAIKAKDMSQISLAQAMIEASQKKSVAANKQMSVVRSKQMKLNGRKRLLLTSSEKPHSEPPCKKSHGASDKSSSASKRADTVPSN